MNSNPPSTEAIAQSIDCFDAGYRARGIRSQRMYPNESLIQFVAQYFSLVPEERSRIRVLEVGCGSGANLWMLAKEGFDTHGLDSSQAGLDIARTHLQAKWGCSAKLQAGSFTQLPYPEGYFDIVVDVVSLQHLGLADSGIALGEVARVLRPQGKFFSYRLSDHSVMFARGGEWLDAATMANIDDVNLPLANNGPISFWSPSLVHLMYAQQGLGVEEISRVARSYGNGMLVEYLAVIAKRP